MVNIGVIGCGYWGPNLIRNFTWNSDSNVVKVCDRSSERLEYIKQLYPHVEITTRAEEIFDDPQIDAVAIATPVRTHYELANTALARGKHVFVEKPIAHSVSASMSLIETAARMERVLMVGHTFEYANAVNRIKEIMDSGELGDPLYIRSQRLNLGLYQKDINVCWDLAPHDISIINYLLGKLPTTVNCQGKSHFNGVEDVTHMTLNYDDGVIAFISSSWLDPNKIRSTVIVGSKKMLVYDDVAQQEKIKIYDKGVVAPPYYDTFGEFQFSYRYGDIVSPRIDDSEPLKKLCTHFIDCIQHARSPKTDGYSGLRVVSILEAATQSLKNGGGPVPINYPPNCSATPEQEIPSQVISGDKKYDK